MLKKRDIIFEGDLKKYLLSNDFSQTDLKELGMLLLGLEKLYVSTNDTDYKDFVCQQLNRLVDADGNVTGVDGSLTDDVFANALFFAVQEDVKYEKAIRNFAAQLAKRARTNATQTCSGVFSTAIEDAYYTQPFYMNYETKFGGKEHYNDIIAQFNILNDLSGDKSVWSENALAAFAAATIDTMEVMEQPLYEIFDRLKRLFKESVAQLLAGHTFIQKDGSTAFFLAAYAMLKGCRMKALQTEKYEACALEAFETVLQETEIADFAMDATGACIMAYAESLRNREYQDYGRNKGGALWS